MLVFKVLLVLLWCIACGRAACPSITICIASGNDSEAECQQHHVIYRLSDLTTNETSETSCKTVHIYLTSGTHFLDKNLDFKNSVEKTQKDMVSMLTSATKGSFSTVHSKTTPADMSRLY